MIAALAVVALMSNAASAGLIWTAGSQEAFNSTTFQTLSPGDSAIANFNITGAGAGSVVWGETWTNVGVGPTTVGGITFTATGLNTLSTTLYYTTGTAVLDSGNNNTGDPTLDGCYVTLSGFVAEKSYILQFLIVDDRDNSAIYDRQSMMQELGTANNSAIVKIGTHPSSLAPYNNREFGLITGTFTGGTSVSVETLLSNSGTFNGNMAQVNAIRVVEVIPEPASGLMLLGSMLGIGLLRRKLHG
jgi:hypothetical protein